MANIFCFVPSYGHNMSTATVSSLLLLQQQAFTKGIGFSFSTLSLPDLPELRNVALSIWYDTLPDSDRMLWIDNDMGFPPELVWDMLLFDEEVIGCMYPQKRLPIAFVQSGLPPDQKALQRGYFVEVRGVGFGVTVVKRSAIKNMLEKMPQLSDDRVDMHVANTLLKELGLKRTIRAFDHMETEVGRLSEDLSFCERHRLCGGKVWTNIAHAISHVGVHTFTGRFLDQVNQPPPEAVEAAMAEAPKLEAAE